MVNNMSKELRRGLPACTPSIMLKAVVGYLGVIAATSYSAYKVAHAEAVQRDLQRSEVEMLSFQLVSGLQRQLELLVSATETTAKVLQLDHDMLLPHGEVVQKFLEASFDRSTQLANTFAENDTETRFQRAKAMLFNSSWTTFEELADSLIHSYKGITNLQLAPSGIVSVIYPVQGNEPAIGLDLLVENHSREGALGAIDAAKAIIVGPVKLLQNGRPAIIVRNPVFIDKPGYVGRLSEVPSWWGFATMLCELDDMLAPTALMHAKTVGISYVLYTETDHGLVPLHMSSEVRPDDWRNHVDQHLPVSQTMEIPELHSKWFLQCWPNEGWKNHSETFSFNIVLCVCFSIASCISVHSMLLRESLITQMRALIPSQ